MGHGNVRVGIVIIHTGTVSDGIHGFKQILHELIFIAPEYASFGFAVRYSSDSLESIALLN